MRVVVYDDDGEACYAYDAGPDEANHLHPGLTRCRRIADALLFAYNSLMARPTRFKVIDDG